MATAEEYAAWIVKNQAKRDTPEFATVAAAYQQAKSKPKTELAPMNVDPTEGMSTTDRFLAGAGKALTDVGRGVGQAVGLVSSDDVNESKKRDAALMNTTAGTVGNIAGNVAAFAPTAMIPGANTITGAALIGAGANAVATPGNFSERGLAALAGGAGGAIGQSIPRAVGVMRAAAEPLTAGGRERIIGRTMNRAVGDDAAAVAARLRGAQPLVPGSMPTAAEVGESGGMAALQRAMSAADPEAYAHRGMQQNAARVQALRDIAGDEGQKEFFRQARSSTANDLYERAFSVPIEVENLSPAMRGEMTRLMQMPAIQDALQVARTNAQNHGMNTNAMEGSVAGLHQAKLALDDRIAALSGGTANQANAARATEAARDRLVTFMERMSPDYNDARTTYAAMSRPINQQDVGQALLNKLQPSLAENGALARETANSYATALRNGDATVRQATGRRMALDEVMDPAQMQSLQAVAQDLGRKANAQDLGRGVGSNTFQNFAMDNLSQSMGMPSAVRAIGGMIPGLSPTATVLARGAQGVGGMAYRNADDAIRRDMAQALLNPQASARLMELAAEPGALAQALRRLPANVQRALPPDEVIRLLQASPGVAGIGLANAQQQ